MEVCGLIVWCVQRMKLRKAPGAAGQESRPPIETECTVRCIQRTWCASSSVLPLKIFPLLLGMLSYAVFRCTSTITTPAVAFKEPESPRSSADAVGPAPDPDHGILDRRPSSSPPPCCFPAPSSSA